MTGVRPTDQNTKPDEQSGFLFIMYLVNMYLIYKTHFRFRFFGLTPNQRLNAWLNDAVSA